MSSIKDNVDKINLHTGKLTGLHILKNKGRIMDSECLKDFKVADWDAAYDVDEGQMYYIWFHKAFLFKLFGAVE